jgi:hypothetical protein
MEGGNAATGTSNPSSVEEYEPLQILVVLATEGSLENSHKTGAHHFTPAGYGTRVSELSHSAQGKEQPGTPKSQVFVFPLNSCSFFTPLCDPRFQGLMKIQNLSCGLGRGRRPDGQRYAAAWMRYSSEY